MQIEKVSRAVQELIEYQNNTDEDVEVDIRETASGHWVVQAKLDAADSVYLCTVTSNGGVVSTIRNHLEPIR